MMAKFFLERKTPFNFTLQTDKRIGFGPPRAEIHTVQSPY